LGNYTLHHPHIHITQPKISEKGENFGFVHLRSLALVGANL
jgi:hypothetical protein